MSEQLYTFGIVYSTPFEMVEEIDVRASSPAAARAAAETLAAEDYQPGWDEIVEMPAGGSGGLVWIAGRR